MHSYSDVRKADLIARRMRVVYTQSTMVRDVKPGDFVGYAQSDIMEFTRKTTSKLVKRFKRISHVNDGLTLVGGKVLLPEQITDVIHVDPSTSTEELLMVSNGNEYHTVLKKDEIIDYTTNTKTKYRGQIRHLYVDGITVSDVTTNVLRFHLLEELKPIELAQQP